MDAATATVLNSSTEPTVPAPVRNWSISLLLFSFIWMFISIIYLFYDAIAIFQWGISFKLVLDTSNLAIMIVISILGILAAEFKTILWTKLYFYVISTYAPFNIIYNICLDDNKDIHRNDFIFIGFITLNILACAFYVLIGY